MSNGIRYANQLERWGKINDYINLLKTESDKNRLPTFLIEGVLIELQKYADSIKPPSTLRGIDDERLYGASATCYHIVDPWEWNGLHCLWCSGWFCY